MRTNALAWGLIVALLGGCGSEPDHRPEPEPSLVQSPTPAPGAAPVPGPAPSPAPGSDSNQSPTPGSASAPTPSPAPGPAPSPAPAPAPAPALGLPPQLLFEPVVTSLDRPVRVTHAGDGSGRLFVLEQPGRVRIVRAGLLLPEPFLDLTSMINTAANERGLLDIAFHPDFAANGVFFLHYSGSAGQSVLARYRVSNNDPDRANPDSGEILLTVPQPYANHNGGSTNFGPDGYLYLALGDGGSGGDPQNRAQNLTTLLGKILRLQVSPSGPYLIPPTNPFAGKPGRDEIWAYGLRNPWRTSFDRLTGDLYIADVGQNRFEEINLQPAGSSGGLNYGWRLFEGTERYATGAISNHVPPIATYGRDLGCSVTGGYVYRGSAILGLFGRYIYGDYCTGRLWALGYAKGSWTTQQLTKSPFQISSFGEDEAGELYLVDHGGGVYRLSVPRE